MSRSSRTSTRRLVATVAAIATTLALSGCYYPYGSYAPGYYRYPATVYAYPRRYYRPYY